MITFPRITCTNLAISITVSIWTIIQTLLHTYVLLYIQEWRNCKISKSENYFSFLFGELSCNLNNSTISDDTQYTEIWDSWVTNELNTLILIYFAFDTLWLISAVGLLTGACCIIREIWALVFYLPWVVTAIIILIYDVFCTIYFGVHVPTDGTFLDWFTFFGLTNKITTVNLENGSLDMIGGALSIIMTFVSAKAIVIWVSNLICLVLIIKITRIEYNTKYNQNHYRNCESGQAQQIKVSRPEKKPIVRTNSQRIRDWYSYYNTGKQDNYIEKKAATEDEEKYYDCIEDNNLFEVHNMSVLNTTKKNELLLSVHSYEHSMPSTSGIPLRKLSNADFSAEKGIAIEMPSTSSGNVMPKPRPIRIVTRDVHEDDSETDDDFKQSTVRDVQKTESRSK